ncbi:MAG: hypothetical protein LBT43_18640, partial [Prevotella sp.]|nr:hypothetical protein [Prevotella sp.]
MGAFQIVADSMDFYRPCEVRRFRIPKEKNPDPGRRQRQIARQNNWGIPFIEDKTLFVDKC